MFSLVVEAHSLEGLSGLQLTEAASFHSSRLRFLVLGSEEVLHLEWGLLLILAVWPLLPPQPQLVREAAGQVAEVPHAGDRLVPLVPPGLVEFGPLPPASLTLLLLTWIIKYPNE